MPYWTSLCVLRRKCRQSSLYETLFHCNTLSKQHHHYHHHHVDDGYIEWTYHPLLQNLSN
jgi:hypothetical protein